MKVASLFALPTPSVSASLIRYARLAVTKVSGAGSMLLLNALLARLLVPELAGTVFFAIALATFASLAARLGLDIASLKNIAALPESQQRSYFHRALLLALAASVPAILIGALVLRYAQASEAQWLPALLLFAVATLALPLMNIASETLKARERTGEGLFWQTVMQPATTLVLALAFGDGLLEIVGCFVFAFLVTTLGAVFQANRMLSTAAPPASRADAPVGWNEMLALGLPLMMIAVVNSVIELSDTLMLGVMRSAEEVSVYYVCAKLAALSTTLLFIINGVIGPALARSWARGDHADSFARVSRYSRCMVALALAVLVALIVTRPNLLAIFGPQYREQGLFPLLVLAIGYFSVLAVGPLCVFMSMTGHQRQYLYNNLGACLANLALNALLIPRYGVDGACFATAVALTIKNLSLYGQYWLIRRRFL